MPWDDESGETEGAPADPVGDGWPEETEPVDDAGGAWPEETEPVDSWPEEPEEPGGTEPTEPTGEAVDEQAVSEQEPAPAVAEAEVLVAVGEVPDDPDVQLAQWDTDWTGTGVA